MRWLRRLLNQSHEPIGRRGERVAAQWLKRRGYRILERNFPLGDDEADIIALDPDGRTIVIVEVKTRSDAQSTPEAAVHLTKQHHIARLAARLHQIPKYSDRPFRFDAVGVILPKSGEPIVRHHPGAFESPW